MWPIVLVIGIVCGTICVLAALNFAAAINESEERRLQRKSNFRHLGDVSAVVSSIQAEQKIIHARFASTYSQEEAQNLLTKLNAAQSKLTELYADNCCCPDCEDLRQRKDSASS